MTFQAEDEIAAVCAAIGASYAGRLGITSTSGPGLALKSEAIGLAVMTELPLVVVDVQRGRSVAPGCRPRPSRPTCCRRCSAATASARCRSCAAAHAGATASSAAYEAVRLATKYMTPVVLLSDGYVANGAEPWRVPTADDLPPIHVEFAAPAKGEAKFHPYARDPKTLARPWAVPGTAGLEHRIGGLEKEDVTGNVSYDPQNHEHMVRTARREGRADRRRHPRRRGARRASRATC